MKEWFGVIYKITNKINGKIYIGQTTNKYGFNGRYQAKGNGIERVYNYHMFLKNSNNKSFNKHLLNSINKYGLYNFDVNEEFDIAYSKEELNKKETYWITYYNSVENGYNKNYGGDNRKMTKKTKDKIRSIKEENSNKKQRVICVTTNEIFDNQYKASWHYNDLYDLKLEPTLITKCCSNKIKYHKKFNDKELVWMYYWEYSLINHYNDNRKVKKSAVININDNNLFLRTIDCANFYNISVSKVDYGMDYKKDFLKINKNKEYNFMRYKNYINTIPFEDLLELHNKNTNKLKTKGVLH